MYAFLGASLLAFYESMFPLEPLALQQLLRQLQELKQWHHRG